MNKYQEEYELKAIKGREGFLLGPIINTSVQKVMEGYEVDYILNYFGNAIKTYINSGNVSSFPIDLQDYISDNLPPRHVELMMLNRKEALDYGIMEYLNEIKPRVLISLPNNEKLNYVLQTNVKYLETVKGMDKQQAINYTEKTLANYLTKNDSRGYTETAYIRECLSYLKPRDIRDVILKDTDRYLNVNDVRDYITKLVVSVNEFDLLEEKENKQL